jgi:hypothetical protein
MLYNLTVLYTEYWIDKLFVLVTYKSFTRVVSAHNNKNPGYFPLNKSFISSQQQHRLFPCISFVPFSEHCTSVQ